MELEDQVQRSRSVGAHHGARIHYTLSYRLHTAVAIGEKVEIGTGHRPRFLEMRLEADPLGTRWNRPVSGKL
jgi:hypothetical protein